jgi:type I restriction enzyme S subunit
MITASNINNGEIQYNTARKTTKSAYNFLLTSKSKPQRNDILLTKDGTLGRLALVKEKKICINQSVAILRPNIKVFPLFLKMLLESPKYQKKMLEDSGGTTIKHIYITIVNLMLIAVPSKLEEQKAIAQTLSDVDALIAALDKLIAKKRNIKTGTMQRLLTGKTRLPGFDGEWETKMLGELGIFSKGAGIKKDDVLDYGLPCIRYGEIYTRHHDLIKIFYSFISQNVASNSHLIKSGDLLFTGSGETSEEIGKCVAFIGDESAYAGGDIVIFSPKEQDSMFLGYLMNHKSIIRQKSRMGQGDAVVHIQAKNLAQLQLYLPPVEEQKAIAQVLSDIDTEIAALEKRRAKTQAIKQGMMQELLTGRTRLKIEHPDDPITKNSNG